MTGFFNRTLINKIRLCLWHNLIFFSSLLLLDCSGPPAEVSLRWKDQRAIGIFIPASLADLPEDSIRQLLTVHVGDDPGAIAIAGDYKRGDGGIIFEPHIPFTPGLQYQIRIRNKKRYEIAIPEPDPAQASAVIAVYPESDTVPDNLLKLYVRFSRAMRESEALKHIFMLTGRGDTLRDVFLELQPELWNDSGTMLTVWLDPGRIKRDLQPNRRMGAPLKAGQHYILVVNSDWKDKAGATLKNTFIKKFVAGDRDSLPPDPWHWQTNVPTRGTRDPFRIGFKEPLDHSLLTAVFRVTDKQNANISGEWITEMKDKQTSFVPVAPWSKDEYILVVETRLEDLAGNNINRPFDRDLTDVRSRYPSGKSVFLPFQVK